LPESQTVEDTVFIPSEPFNGWKIKLPKNKLPEDTEKKKLYLSNLAHSLMVGFKNTSGEILWQSIVFIEDGGKNIEYKLKDFEAKF